MVDLVPRRWPIATTSVLAVTVVVTWSDRHATWEDNVEQHRTGRPRSRRDLGMTALIEGFFAFVWFGWGQANAGPGRRVGLAVAGVVAALVAVAGWDPGVRGPASTGVLHDGQARRRYGVTVGVEFGPAWLAVGLLISLRTFRWERAA